MKTDLKSIAKQGYWSGIVILFNYIASSAISLIQLTSPQPQEANPWGLVFSVIGLISFILFIRSLYYIGKTIPSSRLPKTILVGLWFISLIPLLIVGALAIFVTIIEPLSTPLSIITGLLLLVWYYLGAIWQLYLAKDISDLEGHFGKNALVAGKLLKNSSYFAISLIFGFVGVILAYISLFYIWKIFQKLKDQK